MFARQASAAIFLKGFIKLADFDDGASSVLCGLSPNGLCVVKELGCINVCHNTVSFEANVLQCVQNKLHAIVNVWSFGHKCGCSRCKHKLPALLVEGEMLLWTREEEPHSDVHALSRLNILTFPLLPLVVAKLRLCGRGIPSILHLKVLQCGVAVHATADPMSKENSVLAHFAVWLGGCFAEDFAAAGGSFVLAGLAAGGGGFLPLPEVLLFPMTKFSRRGSGHRQNNSLCGRNEAGDDVSER